MYKRFNNTKAFMCSFAVKVAVKQFKLKAPKTSECSLGSSFFGL